MSRPYRPPPPLPAPSIGRLLADRAAQTPRREFLRFEGASLTFEETNLVSIAAATALGRLGIGPGDRVAIMLPNGLDYPVIWLGVVRLGAVVVPCNTGYQERDLGYVLHDSDARLIVTDAERVPLVRRVAAQCPALERVLLVGVAEPATGDGIPLVPLHPITSADHSLASGSPPAPHGHPAAAWRDDSVGPSHLATLQYTSGTTGFPKGCMLTHEYWLRLGINAAADADLGEGDVVMIMTAWFYMDAAWNLLLCCIKGIPLVILRRFSASTFWQSVLDNGVTFFYCLGTMPTVLLKQPPNPVLERNHRVRAVLCSAIPREQHATIEARFGCAWREAYSTTEIGPVLLSVPLEDSSTVGSGAVGRPSPGAEARVADAEGREVAPGSTGELQMRGPGMMLGYWKNPEATAAWLRDGWAHTGDLATQDQLELTMASDRIVQQRTGEGVALLRFNRPDRLNAMDRASMEELYRLLVEISGDATLRVVIITGTGRAFSAGADLKEMEATSATTGTAAREELQRYQDITRRIAASPVVFISAINGIAVGVGAELSLASDIRIGSDAAEVMLSEVTRGLFQTNGVMHFLPRVVGQGRAAQWLLTGERVKAPQLLEAGFITELVSAERLMPRAQELASTIAANAPLSVRLIKQQLRRTWEVDLETALQSEIDGVMTCRASEDMGEGLRAFVEKRKPVWKGR